MKNLPRNVYIYFLVLGRSILGLTTGDIRATLAVIEDLEEEKEFLLTQLEAATTVVKAKPKKKP